MVKQAGHIVEKPLDGFKILHENRLYRKLMQILNDPTHPMRHYFDSRCSNRNGRFLLLRTNSYKASFLPSALTVFNENYTSYLTVCQRKHFALSEKALFQVILGLLGMQIERKGVYV